MALSYGFCLGEENSQYTSKQFSDAFNAAFGSGLTDYGGQFEVTATDSMSVSVATGYAIVGGRWIKNDSSQILTVQPSDNDFDRYDAVILRADVPSKTVSVVVVQGEASAFPTPYVPVRTDDVYELMLCSILVRMGTSQILSIDLTDTRNDAGLCGFITPFDVVSNDIIYIDQFLNSGIDEEVARLENLAQGIADDAEQTIQAIEDAMAHASISKPVGEIEMLRTPPAASSWLLCDGAEIPVQYAELRALVGDTLPNVPMADPRFSAWIYAGIPAE